ncbi:hypothetical protein AYI68_g6676 [Smittium mucronatum]|uniref:Uncharacterized protein n=1 Tax=Smittium mucronatum TaxID=133383 RepID=A0A1R0GQV3_9FUNG|nr:hypothetical protein AYI68_g6676 [Smittium mucronatum]
MLNFGSHNKHKALTNIPGFENDDLDPKDVPISDLKNTEVSLPIESTLDISVPESDDALSIYTFNSDDISEQQDKFKTLKDAFGKTKDFLYRSTVNNESSNTIQSRVGEIFSKFKIENPLQFPFSITKSSPFKRPTNSAKAKSSFRLNDSHFGWLNGIEVDDEFWTGNSFSVLTSKISKKIYSDSNPKDSPNIVITDIESDVPQQG